MRIVICILIGLGLAISGYLLFRHFSLITASGPLKPSVCSALLRQDCDAALQSSMSKQFGLPLAGWGIVYFGTLAALIALGWLLGNSMQFEAELAALVLAILGATSSVVLFVMMLNGAAPFCPLCAGIHAITWLLVPACKWMAGCSWRQVLQALVAGGLLLLRGKAGRDVLGRLKLLGLFVVGLIAVTLYQWVFIQAKLHPPREFDVRDVLASFAMSVRADIPIGADDPRLGPAEAPITLVVFTDFQCPGCRRFARDMGRLVDGFPGKVQVVFKHFPLSPTCNPALTDDHHPRGCEAAWAAEAARRQGKFWTYHDKLFAADRNFDPAMLGELAQQVELELGQFERDRGRDEIRAKVKADIDLGIRLGIGETPTVYLNGRRSSDVRKQSIHMLIASEIANQTKLPVTPQKHVTPAKEGP